MLARQQPWRTLRRRSRANLRPARHPNSPHSATTEKAAGLWDAQAVVTCNPQAVNRTKKKYLWSWAIAGVVIPLLLLLLGLFTPKPPEWDPFQEPKISPAQHRFAVVATLLWPTAVVAEVLALVVTDAGGDSGAALPSAVSGFVSAGRAPTPNARKLLARPPSAALTHPDN